MNSPVKQLMALISYWKKKCHVVSFDVDGDLSRIYERRDYCWCRQVDGNEFKQPFPTPMSAVVSFVAEKLNLEIIQYHNIDRAEYFFRRRKHPVQVLVGVSGA